MRWWGVRRYRYTGMTLVELMMALAGTGFVGAAVVTMLFAIGRGTEHDRDLRALVVQAKLIDARLGAAIRGSTMVLALSDDALVLWIDDFNDDGKPNLSEIRRIELVEGELRSCRAPDDLPAQNDHAWDLASDWDALTRNLRGTASFPSETWATGVEAWSVKLNDADVQVARLVSYRVTIRIGNTHEPVINAAALRTTGAGA